MSDEILTVITRVHPIFPGTKIPARVVEALNQAGYVIVPKRRPWWKWWAR